MVWGGVLSNVYEDMTLKFIIYFSQNQIMVCSFYDNGYKMSSFYSSGKSNYHLEPTINDLFIDENSLFR